MTDIADFSTHLRSDNDMYMYRKPVLLIEYFKFRGGDLSWEIVYWYWKPPSDFANAPTYGVATIIVSGAGGHPVTVRLCISATATTSRYTQKKYPLYLPATGS